VITEKDALDNEITPNNAEGKLSKESKISKILPTAKTKKIKITKQ